AVEGGGEGWVGGGGGGIGGGGQARRLLAGAARARQRHLVAALLRYHAEPALDQRQVLAVLAEEKRGEAVVIERESDARCRGLADGARREKRSFVRSGGAQRL